MITKAEILWSRKCFLNCQYCNMATGKENTLSFEDWKRVVDNLKSLRCGFIAFYGAEPLLEFEKLLKVVNYVSQKNIATTVITSGVVPSFEEKIRLLYNSGLRSLSMSYDIVPLGTSSDLKTSRAIRGLQLFQSFGEYRDVALIVTLTRKNYQRLPETIKMATELDMWVFFDFIHPDRGQPGSKCKNYSGIKELLFTKEDRESLVNVLQEIRSLKEQGYKCHTSKFFIDMIVQDFSVLTDYKWKCNDGVFPSWVTVDFDGTVYPCDDFKFKDSFVVYGWELLERFDEFSSYWFRQVDKLCPGCCWNTHVDASLIKAGQLPMSDYIHVKGETVE